MSHFWNWVKKQWILIFLILLLVFGCILYPTIFFTMNNIANILRVAGFYGLLAIGMTFVVLTGGIDLSVGCVYAISGIVAAYMSDYGVFAMVAVALLVSLALGFINGILVAKAKIMPFIATLATMMGYRGLALLSTPDAGNIPITNTAFFEMGEGMLFGVIPVPLLILIGCWVAAAVVLNKTSLGRHIYAVGGNAEAARMMGIKVESNIVKAYAICGLMAGLSGLIVAARGQTGQPSLGAGIEMEAVAAVVLGGAVLTGGIGTVTGSVLGMIVLRIISNMINLQGDISYYFQNFITGVLVLVIVIVQSRNVLGKRQKTDSGEEGAVQQTT